MMKWKVCGLKYPDNIDGVLALKPDYIGFIFYVRSARYAGSGLEAAFTRNIEGVRKVGVFVNEELDFIQDHISRYGLDVVQLHGQESPSLAAQVKELGVEVMKVFSVKDQLDQESMKPYVLYIDYVLFDTQVKGKLGGTGQTFDWTILQDYGLDIPFWISGGLSLANIEEVVKIEHPQFYGVDINSKFEEKPGLKSLEKLRAFTEIINKS